MDPLRSEIYRILSEEFSVPWEEISDELGPGDLSKWDSIGQIRLIARLEETFHLQFAVSDMISMNHVKEIVETIRKRLPKESKKETSPLRKKVFQHGIKTSPLRLPRRTHWGEGSLSALSSLERSRVAVVTGSSAYAAALQKKARSFLSGRTVSFIQKPPRETTEGWVHELAKELEAFSPDAIVALGGGSSIDGAKLGWVLYEHPTLNLEEFFTPFTLPPLRKKAILIAVPTTFGTGAEVSSAATYSKEGELGKSILVSHELLPDQSILDPGLGQGTPLPIVYASAFDALTHAIEGYVSIVRNPLIEPYAVLAVRTILSALGELLEAKKLSKEILWGLATSSYYAGIVQNHCSVGLTHSFAHQLGSFGLAHGQANALFLSAVMTSNAEKAPHRYETLAAGCGFRSHSEMIASVAGLTKAAPFHPDHETWEKLSRHRSSIVEGAMKDITFKTNPVSFDQPTLERIFGDLLQRWKP